MSTLFHSYIYSKSYLHSKSYFLPLIVNSMSLCGIILFDVLVL